MNLHMHTKVAGSGFHIPFDAHIDVMFPAGTYDVLQLKNISEPCCVPWELSSDWTEPFSGWEGAPQPTGEGEYTWSRNWHLATVTISPCGHGHSADIVFKLYNRVHAVTTACTTDINTKDVTLSF